MPDYRWSHYLTAPWELIDELYRAVKFGVRNLYQWFPVIWSDRHYTSDGLFKVMQRKLVLMQGELRRNPYHVGAERDLHLMHVCEMLLERYLANDYHENCVKHHREKWGEMRCFLNPHTTIQLAMLILKFVGGFLIGRMRPIRSWRKKPVKSCVGV